MTKHSTVFSLLVACIAIMPLIVIANEGVLSSGQEKEVIAVQYGENSPLLKGNMPPRESFIQKHATVMVSTSVAILLVTWGFVEFVRTRETPAPLTKRSP